MSCPRSLNPRRREAIIWLTPWRKFRIPASVENNVIYRGKLPECLVIKRFKLPPLGGRHQQGKTADGLVAKAKVEVKIHFFQIFAPKSPAREIWTPYFHTPQKKRCCSTPPNVTRRDKMSRGLFHRLATIDKPAEKCSLNRPCSN